MKLNTLSFLYKQCLIGNIGNKVQGKFCDEKLLVSGNKEQTKVFVKLVNEKETS